MYEMESSKISGGSLLCCRRAITSFNPGLRLSAASKMSDLGPTVGELR